MGAVTRCKMRVSEVTRSINADGTVDHERVRLSAVTSGLDENKEWAKWTPFAQFEIQINNPAAIGKLSRGHEYYVDFIPVTPPPAVEKAEQAGPGNG